MSAISSVSSDSAAASSSALSMVWISDSRTESETSSRISPSFSALDQIPHQPPFVERQRFQNVGDVGRVQRFQLALQLGQVLLVHQVFDQRLARPALLVDEFLHQPHLGEQGLHLDQVRFQVVLRLGFEGIGHDRAGD